MTDPHSSPPHVLLVPGPSIQTPKDKTEDQRLEERTEVGPFSTDTARQIGRQAVLLRRMRPLRMVNPAGVCFLAISLVSSDHALSGAKLIRALSVGLAASRMPGLANATQLQEPAVSNITTTPTTRIHPHRC